MLVPRFRFILPNLSPVAVPWYWIPEHKVKLVKDLRGLSCFRGSRLQDPNVFGAHGLGRRHIVRSFVSAGHPSDGLVGCSAGCCNRDAHACN